MVCSLSIITTPYHYERSIPCKKIVKNLLLLAHNLLFKICAELIDFIKKIVTSPEFIERNRHSHKNFTRQRKLPFHVLIAFLLNFVKGSYQDELDKFFKRINKDSRIALESCSCWEYVYDYLADMGFTNVVLANPSRVRLIATSKKKTDTRLTTVLINTEETDSVKKLSDEIVNIEDLQRDVEKVFTTIQTR